MCYIKINIFCGKKYCNFIIWYYERLHVQRIGLNIMVLKLLTLVYIECKLGWVTKLIAVKVYNPVIVIIFNGFSNVTKLLN